MDLDPSLFDYFGDTGVLAKKLSGFAPRRQQQEMAEAVAQALEQGHCLVSEAGTGTGKTFAYLVPALLSGKKVIISTGTKTLQDQLFQRDLPVVREALGVPVTVALLKGRANYLCPYRLRLSGQQGELFPDRETVSEFSEIVAWAKRTQSGDIMEMRGIPDDSAVWPMVTSTAENCLGQNCPDFKGCFVVKARKDANAADVLVINHHLFFADMALHEEGFGELLPGAEAVIFDEAHQLPHVASNFFGDSFSSRQCAELSHDSIQAERLELGDNPLIAERCQQMEKMATRLFKALGQKNQRSAWQVVAEDAKVQLALKELREALSDVEQILETVAERSKTLENSYRRSQELQQALFRITEYPPANHVQWFETFSHNFILHLTPLGIAQQFNKYRSTQNRSWIFTSATLSVGEDFSHFCRQMGLEGDVRSQRWDSPFDYRRAALLYVPQNLPEPRSEAYTAAVVNAALPVLEMSKGRAFFLFTSHRALQEAAEMLEDEGLDYPLLVQGRMPRAELLEQFRALGNAILLGTGSFWEGVDVRGEALSCVIIDKLPFASPGDPVMEARIKHLREQGGNPFIDYQVPQAVISLKQGVGRLIRDVTDRGVLMLCDPRLIDKPYGRIFLNSLPEMYKTRFADKVEKFFTWAAQQDG